MKPGNRIFTLIVSVVCFGAAYSWAGEDRIRATFKQGKVILQVNGRVTHTKKIADADPNVEGTINSIHLAENRFAFDLRYTTTAGVAVQAVFIEQPAGRLKRIWNEPTALKGDLGERVGRAVRFEDLTGDGLPETVAGTIAENVRLCQSKSLPLLFRQVYDWRKGRFRPILARRPGGTGPVDIRGYRIPLKDHRTPLVRHLSPLCVSRAAGDRQNPSLLAMPVVLTDGDPTTHWTPIPANGAGEFATFNVLSQTYGISRIGILPVSTTTGRQRFDQPQTAFLRTDDQVYHLTFPADEPNQEHPMVWFDFPQPVRTGCLSLIIESTRDSAAGPLGLAEIIALTEVDQPAGIDQLVADLNNSQLRGEAARLLEQVGEEAITRIRASWSKLDKQARRLAIDVLAKVGSAAAIDLLVEAAVGRDPIAAQNAARGITAAGDRAIPSLVSELGSDEVTRFTAAVKLLAALGSPAAIDGLAGACGKGDHHRRALLRETLAGVVGRSPQGAEHLGSLIEAVPLPAENERSLDLMRAGAESPALTIALAERVANQYQQARTFDDRYRLLGIMVQLGSDADQGRLLEAAADPDPLIRAIAISGLGRDTSGIAPVLKQALSDEAPQVRLASLESVERAGQLSTIPSELVAIATTDPWPHVRARATQGAVQLDPKIAITLLTKTIADRSATVRLAALNSAIAIADVGANRIIESRLTASDETAQIKAKAAFGAGKRCQQTALPALFDLLQKGAEPLAQHDEIATAVAAAKAIGAIGTDEAKGMLEKASRRSNPATDKAIAEALKSLGNACRQ